MTHICVSGLTSIGSDNGLSPGRRQAIIRTNAGILLIRPLGTNFSEFSVEMLIICTHSVEILTICTNITQPGHVAIICLTKHRNAVQVQHSHNDICLTCNKASIVKLDFEYH